MTSPKFFCALGTFRISMPLALLLSGPVVLSPVFAQTAVALPSSMAPLPTIVDREPYNRWIRHTGTPGEAVVHVRVVLKEEATGQIQVREGSGFIVRCDGFVLVPSLLMVPEMRIEGQARPVPLANLKTTLTFGGADGSIPPPQSVPFPRFWDQSRRYGFTLLKVNNLHFKGIRMLDPKNVREGMAVHLVSAVPAKEKPGKVEAVVVPATVGDALGKDKTRYTFAATPSIERVAAGALAVDAESQLAIGIVVPAVPAAVAGQREEQRQGSPMNLLTFAGFNRISNAVGLLPDAAAALEPGSDSGEERDGMVWVPGGPVVLEGQWLIDYARLYGTPVACTPGFWIDVRQVTNEEYRDFLGATGHRSFPPQWNPADVETPRRWTGSLPIVGVTPPDAQSYARWRSKRLVTPVEWLRASRGAGTSPEFKKYKWEAMQALLSMFPTLRRLADAEGAAIRAALIIARSYSARTGSGTAPSAATLDPTFPQFNEETAEIHARRRALVEAFNSRFGYPSLVLPAGERTISQSVFGVRDAVMGVPELLLPNPAHRPVEQARKAGFLMTPWYPDFPPQIKLGEPGYPMTYPYDLPLAEFQATFGDIASAYAGLVAPTVAAITAAIPVRLDYRWISYAMPFDGAGFRCAR